LFQDNLQPHSAEATVEVIRQQKFELLPHPPYSSDLTPSDYHMFGLPEEYLYGQKLASNNAVKDAVNTRGI
jgi:hypothetical protein